MNFDKLSSRMQRIQTVIFVAIVVAGLVALAVIFVAR
jgi:hypothetical protein